MEYYWNWFCDQLEQKPGEEEAELLRDTLEQVVEAPPGMEPRSSLQLLQKRIGNQAVQRLLRMRDLERATQGKPAAAGTAGPAEKPAERKPEHPAPQTAADVMQSAIRAEREPQAAKTGKHPVQGPSPATPSAGRTPESQLAWLLVAFVNTLGQGGGAAEWQALAAAAKDVAPRARDEAVRMIVDRFHQLEQTQQKLFLQRLVRWQQDSSDKLASLLWARLSLLVRGAPPQSPGADHGNVH